MSRRFATVVLITTLLSACGKPANEPVDINRSADENSAEIDVAALNAAEPEDPNVFRTRVYRLSTQRADSLLNTVQNPRNHERQESDAGPVDPFAAPTQLEPFVSVPPIKVNEARSLEDYFAGSFIDFPEGASASYDAVTEQLEITHNLAAFNRIEIVLEQLRRSAEHNVVLRVDLYELPVPLILELGESAASHSDHTPEWKAIQQLVDDGDARPIASLSLTGRSGNRGKATAGKSITCAGDYRWDENQKKFLPIEIQHFVGTQIEFDLVVGADNKTIDVNLRLEHHTSPPGEGLVELQAPDGNASFPLPVPTFHRHEITTQITTLSGHQNLIGMWRPSIPPSPDHLADHAQVAFLKATVRSTNPIERIR